MEVIKHLFTFLHFVGFSTLFGAHAAMIYTNSKKTLNLVRFGGILAVIAGSILYMIEIAQDGHDKFNNAIFGIKLSLVVFSILIPNIASRMKLDEKKQKYASILSFSMLLGIFILMIFVGVGK